MDTARPSIVYRGFRLFPVTGGVPSLRPTVSQQPFGVKFKLHFDLRPMPKRPKTNESAATVFIVGAGPGDPDLLTRKAARVLAQAEVVYHDDLVPQAILDLAPSAEVVNVGKRCGTKKITQGEINALLVDAARAGRLALRLKSGDPAIFGRLGDEIDALAAAQVPFEIIPGVTAGMAAAASLGVSLTDRRAGGRVILVSGHPAHADQPDAKPEWKRFAHEDATLVIYMPGHEFGEMQAELLGGGLNADTPAAIVSRAGTAGERHHVTRLGELHRLPTMERPAILLIGRALERLLHQRGARVVSLALDNPGVLFSER